MHEIGASTVPIETSRLKLCPQQQSPYIFSGSEADTGIPGTMHF